MKNIIKATIVVFLLFCSRNIFAMDPNEPGMLEVHVAVANSPEYINEWMGTPASNAVHIKRLYEVIPEQTAYISAIVTGFGITDDLKTNIIADFQMFKPDGDVLFEEKDMMKHIQTMKEKGAKSFVMLDPAIDIVLEDSDEEGVYTIRITARDKVLNTTAAGEYRLTFVKTASISDLKLP